MAIYKDATSEEVEIALHNSWQAFQEYRLLNLKQRADFLRMIAKEIEKVKDVLISIAHKETHLDKPRLEVELKRTVFQMINYAQACEEGAWLDIRIDTADPARNPPKPDLRKMLVPLGPVVVFGASNFPFAYSTAGGDTACALASGCSVLIKAHPAHAETSETVAHAVKSAAKQCNLPESIFIHLHGSSFEVGRALIQHPLTKAVGFTGSFEGGRSLFDLANERSEPIPVFAEMGSVNPVFLLPEKLKQETEKIASMYAVSVTQSAGQFCTNPGIMVGIDGEDLNYYIQLLGKAIEQTKPVEMLHPGIARNFHSKRSRVLQEAEVLLAAETSFEANETESIPTIAETTGKAYLKDILLHKEVFGPFSLVVKCRD